MNVVLRKLKERVKKISRQRKNDFFYSLVDKNSTVLDVGVFPEAVNGNKDISTNHFLKGFKFAPQNYTGLSIDSLAGMDKIYPGMRFVQYNGGVFPFKDREFDWAYSNAVIEHVGDYDTKLLFVKEMVRTCKNVFFTTPNKYFPVDAHTMVFFIHWNDNLFWNWRQKNKKWLPKASLNLLSYGEIKRLLKDANVKNFKIIKNRFCGMTMTFSVIISGNESQQPSANKIASEAQPQKDKALVSA
jgi:hypothetical protein